MTRLLNYHDYTLHNDYTIVTYTIIIISKDKPIAQLEIKAVYIITSYLSVFPQLILWQHL